MDGWPTVPLQLVSIYLILPECSTISTLLLSLKCRNIFFICPPGQTIVILLANSFPNPKCAKGSDWHMKLQSAPITTLLLEESVNVTVTIVPRAGAPYLVFGKTRIQLKPLSWLLSWNTNNVWPPTCWLDINNSTTPSPSISADAAP